MHCIIPDMYRIYHTNIYGSDTNCVDFAYTGANNLCSTNNPTNFNAKKTTLFGRPDTHFNIHLIS